MNINVEFWQLVSLLITFFAFVFAAGKFLLSQIDQRLNVRFASIVEAQKVSEQHTTQQINILVEQNRKDVEHWQKLERDFMEWKANLPITYVMRDDYVRNQTVIEAKLDSVALKIENLQIRSKND